MNRKPTWIGASIKSHASIGLCFQYQDCKYRKHNATHFKNLFCFTDIHRCSILHWPNDAYSQSTIESARCGGMPSRDSLRPLHGAHYFSDHSWGRAADRVSCEARLQICSDCEWDGWLSAVSRFMHRALTQALTYFPIQTLQAIPQQTQILFSKSTCLGRSFVSTNCEDQEDARNKCALYRDIVEHW